MGCDIHMVVEKKVKGQWIATDTTHYSYPGRDRYYERFGAICDGVRGYSGIPGRGVPKDVSATAKYLIDEYGADGHNHSWLTLEDAVSIFLKTEHNPSDFAKKYPASHFFNIDLESSPGEYRIVFWFDN